MRLKVISSESGMSLVGVMLASAVAIVVITGTLSSIAFMYQTQRSVGLSQERDMLMNEIKFNVESAGLCNASLAGKTLGTGLTNGVTFSVGGTPVNLQEGQLVPNQTALFVRTLRIENNTAVAPKNVVVALAGAMVTLERRMVNLVLQVEKVNAQGPSSPPRYIPFTVLTRPGTQLIEFCDTMTVAASLCQETGSVWNSTLSKCVPTNKCDYGGSFSDPSAPLAAGPFPNPITGSYSCPTGYTGVRSGTLTYSTSCGKRCVDNQYYAVYECIVCYDTAGNSVLPASATPVPPNILGINVTDDLNEAETEFTNQYNNVNTLWPIIF